MAEPGKYVYKWPRPMVTVDAVVFAVRAGRAEVVLIRRGKEPFKGGWALPGGFVEMDEELVDAAARELAEETGIEGVQLEQLAAFGRCGRDPRGRNISVVFMGICESRRQLKAGDDAAGAGWFDIDKLPDNLGFDHDDVIAQAVNKLKKSKTYKERVSGR